MLALGSLIPLVVVPSYQIVKFIRQPGRMRKVKKARAAGFFAVAGATLAGILLIPTPLRVQGTLVLTAAKPAPVYAEVPGRLVSLEVRDNQWVKRGTILAKLSNPEKFRERLAMQEQLDINTVKSDAFGASSLLTNRGLAEQYRQNALDLEPALDKINDQIGKLTLIAPRDGLAIGVPHAETTGQWLKPGKPFCEVGDPTRLEAHLILDQSDVDLVRFGPGGRGPRAWVKVYGDSERTHYTRVAEVAKRNSDEIPPELSNLAEGEIATKPDQKTGQAKPLSAVYEVIIPLDNSDHSLQPGLRGFAKIDGGTYTVGWWLWRLITKTFHFTL
jgi:putative peptide zinc metalloprotease protein